MLNAISDHPDFAASCLNTIFTADPFGFMDVGSVGGIHPSILPMASHSRCTCFEPDPGSYRVLRDLYRANNPFAGFTIFDCALSDSGAVSKLHITKSPVNTSLLEPDEEFAARYGISGLAVENTIDIRTNSLDRLLSKEISAGQRTAEMIKLDCQGAEYKILKGAANLLDEQCIAVICEVLFSRMYRDQKVFSDLDLLLSEKGFVLYGMEPHFVSARKLDRTRHDTQERLLWADAIYFRDPLTVGQHDRGLTRKVQSLFIAALLTGYYDLALELLDTHDWPSADRDRLSRLTVSLAGLKRKELEDDADRLLESLAGSPEKKYLLVKKFIDAHRANNNIDFLTV